MNFSIITVTYNSEECLSKAMQSILLQTGGGLQYVLVDGGSQDGTVELIRSAAQQDDRIRWVSEPDDGIADAFNKGLKMATGDWVGILNSDDCYAPGALRAVADAVAANPDADVIHGDMLRLDTSGNPLFVLQPADLTSAIWHQMPLNHPTVFVSRRAYERVGGFDKTLRIAMDYDLILRLYKSGANFVYLDRVLAHMRYGGASDDRLWQGLREVRDVSVREGYPRLKANAWMAWRGALGAIKWAIRRLGLTSLLRCHPRFGKAQP